MCTIVYVHIYIHTIQIIYQIIMCVYIHIAHIHHIIIYYVFFLSFGGILIRNQRPRCGKGPVIHGQRFTSANAGSAKWRPFIPD